MGLGKRGRLRVDQPTITGRTRPGPDAYSPLFACDGLHLCRSIHRPERKSATLEKKRLQEFVAASNRQRVRGASHEGNLGIGEKCPASPPPTTMTSVIGLRYP